MELHKLKTHLPYFKEVATELKQFEVRKDDRNFKEGDLMLLQEYSQHNKEYTGLEQLCQITYILKGGQFGIEKGYVVIGFKLI